MVLFEASQAAIVHRVRDAVVVVVIVAILVVVILELVRTISIAVLVVVRDGWNSYLCSTCTYDW